jgi:hypothetical protein
VNAARSNGGAAIGGTAEVWYRVQTSSQTFTVTVIETGNVANGFQIVTKVLNGVLTGSPTGATAVQSNNTSAAMSVSIAAGSGNRIYGACYDYTTNANLTALGNTTITQFQDGTNVDTWAAVVSNADTAGTATYGSSTSCQGNIALVEFVAAPSPPPSPRAGKVGAWEMFELVGG